MRLLLEEADQGPLQRTSAVFVPSEPTDDLVWARIRGYPWWPARVHKATRPRFDAALEKRGRKLVVFVGESVQYFLAPDSLAAFTGALDDPRLPKPGKGGKQLNEAVLVARAILEASQKMQSP